MLQSHDAHVVAHGGVGQALVVVVFLHDVVGHLGETELEHVLRKENLFQGCSIIDLLGFKVHDITGLYF